MTRKFLITFAMGSALLLTNDAQAHPTQHNLMCNSKSDNLFEAKLKELHVGRGSIWGFLGPVKCTSPFTDPTFLGSKFAFDFAYGAHGFGEYCPPGGEKAVKDIDTNFDVCKDHFGDWMNSLLKHCPGYGDLGLHQVVIGDVVDYMCKLQSKPKAH